MKVFKYAVLGCFISLGLIACGSGSSGGSGNGQILTGVFIDSPVKGLRWVSGSTSGTTDILGTFQYQSGADVSFYIADMLIGSAKGDSVLIPLDLVADAQDITNQTVTNIVRFFMTIDNDNNPSNGIEITDEMAQALTAGTQINFAQSDVNFSSSDDVQRVITALTEASREGSRPIVSSADAQEHAENSLKGTLDW